MSEQRRRQRARRPRCGKRAAAWRRPKRARWNPKMFPGTQPRVDACTRTRISVYRRDGGDDAAEKRERPIPRDTRGGVSAGRRERIWIRSFFYFRSNFLFSEINLQILEIIDFTIDLQRLNLLDRTRNRSKW